MYPSWDIPTVARAAKEEFVNCNLDVEVDDKELALYIAITHVKKKLVELGLD